MLKKWLDTKDLKELLIRILVCLVVGVILGVFQLINTKAIANINGTLLFPTYNAGTLILSTLSSMCT